jgi:dienelactone hydrolase
MMAQPSHTVDIPSADAHPVRGDLYLPASGGADGIVLLCHGFKGHKSWAFFPYVAKKLSEAGLAALSLDMSFNGTFPAPVGDSATAKTDSTPRYCRPDLFERNTIKREYHDLKHVIHHVTEGGLRKYIEEPLPIGLFGHSRGGVAAILNAVEQPEVRVLCTWSVIDDPDFFTREQKEKWRREGKYHFVDSTDGTQLAVGVDYLDDLEENHDVYLLRERVKELQVPHLIVHGKADMIVGVECALTLHQAEQQLRHKQLLLLQTGHTFGVPHPAPPRLSEPSTALKHATDETVAWFKTHLQGGGVL